MSFWNSRYHFSDEDRPATMAEAHLEWHRNTGVPVGTPGCPQDACHPPDLTYEDVYTAEERSLFDREEAGYYDDPDEALWSPDKEGT